MAKAKAKKKKTVARKPVKRTVAKKASPRKKATKARAAVAPKKKLSPGKKKPAKRNVFGLSTASEALSLLDHIRQKNPAIKLADGTVLHGKMLNVFLKEAKRQNPKSKRNIQMGFYAGGSFHPIRSSADYDYDLAGEHKPDRRTKTGKTGATRTKRHKALKGSESVLARSRRQKAARPKPNLATSYPWKIEFKSAAGIVDTGFARTKADAIRRGKTFAGKRSDHSAVVVEVSSGKKTTVKRNPFGIGKIWHVYTPSKRGTVLALTKGGAQRAANKEYGKGATVARNPKSARNSYLMLVNKGTPKTGAKRSGAKRKKRNEGLREEFTGMPSTRTDVIDLPDSAPAKTERLGERVKIFYRKDGEAVSPPGDDNEGITKSFVTFSRDVFLESNSEGNRYFFGAKPGGLPVFTKNGTFGPATRIEYWARKPHLENGDKSLRPYFHVFGEEDGKRPIFGTDKDGLPILKGGNYRTNQYGINN